MYYTTSLCKCVFNAHNMDIMLSAYIVRGYFRVSYMLTNGLVKCTSIL